MADHRRVFDSWAVMAFLNDEPSADQVEQLVIQAQGITNALLITVVNLGEIWYNIARVRSEAIANAKIRELVNAGFVAIEIDWELAKQAAAFKSKHALAYADCFAAALARQENVELVTGDPEFRQLEKQIKILWV